MGIIQTLKSGIAKGEIIKSLNKLNPTLIIPAVDNILDSIGLVDKDKQEVKTEIGNKLQEVIRGLNPKG